MSKIENLLEALLSGQAITLKDSVNLWKLYALSQTIGVLKRRRVPIETELVPIRDDGSGKVKKYGKYRIPPAELAAQRAKFGKS